jgi:hypothetical protein
MLERLLASACLLALACGCRGEAEPQPAPARDPAAFYAAPPDPGAALPADGIFPQGRKLAFMGYSGDPQRDLANGFTVAGPVYGDQSAYLRKCLENGWPVVAHIGPKVTFHDKATDRYRLDEPKLRAEVARQMSELAQHQGIVWWAVHPEELRPWRADEMRYLEIVSSEIRAQDPLRRPVFLYNPNHRDASTLEPVARHVDIVAKGCYVNLSGKKRDRAWVRWSIEQEAAAIVRAGRPGAIPLLMPELCEDPPPEEHGEIAAWTRHDIYLGLAAGAKGVNIWSLFKRREVRETWPLWYDGYRSCAMELNGPRGLAQVFLFGERRHHLTVTPLDKTTPARLRLGGDIEPETSNAAESAARSIEYPSWTAAEFAHDSSRFLFLIHSGNQPASFTIQGAPAGSLAEDAFNGRALGLHDDQPLRLDLPAYGVAAIRFHRETPN